MTKIVVSRYREGVEPTQMVSGRMERERVHDLAPPSARVPEGMTRLLQWFNAGIEPDALVRAALTHLWFETIHPFEDGNGRFGRVWVDLVLGPATAAKPARRFEPRSACSTAATTTTSNSNGPGTADST
jgi:Fic family protein